MIEYNKFVEFASIYFYTKHLVLVEHQAEFSKLLEERLKVALEHINSRLRPSYKTKQEEDICRHFDDIIVRLSNLKTLLVNSNYDGELPTSFCLDDSDAVYFGVDWLKIIQDKKLAIGVDYSDDVNDTTRLKLFK